MPPAEEAPAPSAPVVSEALHGMGPPEKEGREVMEAEENVVFLSF